MGNELSILSGNKMGSPVEAIGTCTLTLDNGFVLVLERTFYVPSFSRNLISVSRLVPLGFSFTFQDNVFNLFYKSNNIGTGILADGLYRICLQNEATNNSLHVHIGTKRCNINEDSSMLWHRRLGHISIDRNKRLVKDGVLSTLDYTDFETCVDCIKGKQTNKSKKHANRSSNILEIIHTDICCPDMDMPGQKYFITFIDDYSRYMYVYLLHNKYEALDAFKIFKAEVENQCGKQIHIVRYDRGGEYYGRYTENGQAPGPFAKFLQEHGIIAQHTMPGSPDQNGVAERRNRTLVDMVRSMLSNSNLPQFLWTDALKTAVYILNRVPIMKGDKLSLNQCPKNDLENESMKNIPYASVVGSLMYAQVCTRPDIAYAVGVLGRYQSNPGVDHWRAAKKVMRYLQGTKDYMLMYRHTDNLDLVGYSDADFAGCVDSRKSTSGYIFIMAGGAVSWRSVKQTLIATSTMEAEFVSCFQATSQGVWLKSFISGLRVMDSISRPLKIFCDNSAAVFLAKNNKSGSRSKHIDIKYLAIREHVKEKKVVIEHISTELMIADPLTKGMPPMKFKDHVDRMGIVSSL